MRLKYIRNTTLAAGALP